MTILQGPSSRRTMLRGLLQGGAVTLGLPILDCLLNTNGTAFANGAPLPVRFGTWFWGLGMNPARWVPEKTGANFDITPELAHLKPFKDSISVFSKFAVPLDGKTNFCHYTGNVAVRTGIAPATRSVIEGASLEVMIAAAIGQAARFRSLEVACTGVASDSLTWSEGNALNPSEISPAALYTRIFGPDFRDPNAADFTPDPKAMVMQSVLSAVKEDRQALMARAGAADRQRLDQYFSSLRQVEQQVAIQLEKPAPALACAVPTTVAETKIGTDVEDAAANHRLFVQLLAMALACNQTNVFNIVYSNSGSNLRMKGVSQTHHICSHEESVDAQSGIQVKTTSFLDRAWECQAEALATFAAFKEGDRTLLDSMLMLMHSDCEVARTHTIDGIPIILAGKAGGRIKTGLHVSGNSIEPVSRIGLTAMTAMGVSLDGWGGQSMRTAKPIAEILA
jgi:hypothetical protein